MTESRRDRIIRLRLHYEKTAEIAVASGPLRRIAQGDAGLDQGNGAGVPGVSAGAEEVNEPRERRLEERMSADRWCYSSNEEIYSGDCASREDAIAEAISEEITDPGCPFWIGKQSPPDVELCMTHDEVLERLSSQANDNCSGDWAEDWPECPEGEPKAALVAIVDAFNESVNNWIEKHAKPTWFSVIDPEKLIMSERAR